jgi:hypothetical protein
LEVCGLFDVLAIQGQAGFVFEALDDFFVPQTIRIYPLQGRRW